MAPDEIKRYHQEFAVEVRAGRAEPPVVSTVIGLDLSLASTGVAGVLSTGGWAATVHSKPTSDLFARLRAICGEVFDYVRNANLVVVEGLAISRQTGQHLTRAGLWHIVMERIDAAGIPWAEAGPTVVKKYATGNGSASKDAVLLAVERRWGKRVRVDNNNEADALTLAAMGAHHLGMSTLPTVPKTHAAVLDKIRWPAFAAMFDLPKAHRDSLAKVKREV